MLLISTYFMLLRGKYGAGEGNRTPVISLEGFCSTIELHPLTCPISDSHLKSGGGGWIRTIVD